jgi:hypothetical protein
MDEVFDIPKPHRIAIVPRKSRGTVFLYKVPSGYTAFIRRIGNNLWKDTYWVIMLDGEPIEPKTERIIGSVMLPTEINPPYVAISEIRADAVNDTLEDLVFEILLEGIVVRDR